MRFEERWALTKHGLIIPTIKYGDFSQVILLPLFLLRFPRQDWPEIPMYRDFPALPGTNTCVLVYGKKQIGLSIDSNGESIGVSLSHPVSKYWLSILQPIWNAHKPKCPTCRDTGWDGIGYTLTCVDCGKSK